MKNRYLTSIIMAAAIAAGALTSCNVNCEKGSGSMHTEVRTMKDFKKIDISGGYKVTLKQDSSLTVAITADDNLLQYIKTNIDGGHLKIETKKSICTEGDFELVIGVRNLEAIRTAGAVKIITDGK